MHLVGGVHDTSSGQLFLADHAGLPLKTVLEQLDLLGGEVVPVLRKEFAALPHVPDAPGRGSRGHSREQAALSHRSSRCSPATTLPRSDAGVPPVGAAVTRINLRLIRVTRCASGPHASGGVGVRSRARRGGAEFLGTLTGRGREGVAYAFGVEVGQVDGA